MLELSAEDDRMTIVESARRGDRDSFMYLVTQYYPRAFPAAVAILRNRQDAEDALQEACLTAYKRIRSLKNNHSFGPWFLRIVVNKSLDIRKARRPTIALDDASYSLYADDLFDVDVALDIRDALSRLPGSLQTLIALRQSGLSSKEIGQAVERPPGTVRRQLAEAYKTLHEDLGFGS